MSLLRRLSLCSLSLTFPLAANPFSLKVSPLTHRTTVSVCPASHAFNSGVSPLSLKHSIALVE
jgi:hypothetical protein